MERKKARFRKWYTVKDHLLKCQYFNDGRADFSLKLAYLSYLYFSFFLFYASYLLFYFFFYLLPSRILDPLRFQAEGRRRRPNLGLVCFDLMFAVFLVKDARVC